jgi:hypothetical protein
MSLFNSSAYGIVAVVETDFDCVESVSQLCSAHLSFFDINDEYVDDMIVGNEAQHQKLSIKEWLKVELANALDSFKKKSVAAIGLIQVMVSLPDGSKFLNIDFGCKGMETDIDFIYSLIDSKLPDIA